MLDGYGDQQFLRKSYLEDRQKALLDRTLFDQDELDDLEIGDYEGWGTTAYSSYEIYQQGFPLNTSIRPRQKVNIKLVKPELGETSDV